MLPAFHGERMRSYEPIVREIVDAEIDAWPLGEEFALHSRMQAVTLEVILRVVFGVAEGPRLQRLRGLLRNLLTETSDPMTQILALAKGRQVKGSLRIRTVVDRRLDTTPGSGGTQPGLDGSPAELRARVEEYQAAGVDHLVVYFEADDVQTTLRDMRRFATEIVPAFHDGTT